MLHVLDKSCCIMALPCWMRVIVSVIYEVAAFLIHEPQSNSRDINRTPCAFDGFTSHHDSSSESLGLSDYLLSSLSSALGLELPRAVTILNGLPLATSLLLRLTEVLPPELLLFFCITGMIFWVTCAILCVVLVVCTSGLLCSVVCWPPRTIVRWITSLLGRSAANSTPPRLRAAPPRQALPPNRPSRQALPPNRPAALSDQAQTFVDDVRAHNPTVTPPGSRRRSQRHSTR